MTLQKIIQIFNIRVCFTQTFMDLNMKTIFDPKTIKFGDWNLESSFQKFGPKSLSKS